MFCSTYVRRLLLICSRMFRVVPAAEFIAHFASDRSHMIDKEATQDNCNSTDSNATTLPNFADAVDYVEADQIINNNSEGKQTINQRD